MSEPTDILAGLRVVELATYIFGPASATLLSDFGADVIKIERPPHGDTYRQLFALKPMPKSDANYCWILDNRNKKSVGIDVSTPDGREVALKLIQQADVFITNYRPDILAKLRLGYDDVQPLNERLIYAHATGFGEKGDEANKPGFDQTAYWARSGLMFALHNADAEPCPSVCGMGDHPSAMTLFAGILLALVARQQTGRGTKVSSSLMANGFWSNSCQIQAAICGAEFFPRRKRTTTFNPLVNHYVTRDEKRFVFCLIHPERDWTNLCMTLGCTELVEDERFCTPAARSENSSELVAFIDGIISTKDMAEWAKIFAQRGLIWSPVASAQEVADDPRMVEQGFFVEFDDPAHGKLKIVDSPLQLRGVEKVPPRPAPMLGAHTREVLRSLGYEDEQIERMLRAGGAVDSPIALETSGRA